MTVRFFLIACVCAGLGAVSLLAQNDGVQIFQPRVVIQDTDRGLPGAQFEYDISDMVAKPALQAIVMTETSPIPFTGLAVGWRASDRTLDPHLFQVDVRTRSEDQVWTRWYRLKGYYRPEDTPSDLYWTELYVTDDGSAHPEFEIIFYPPQGVSVEYLRIYTADARLPETTLQHSDQQNTYNGGLKPEIITRAEWWGNLPPDQLEPNYTPVPITITHAIVHHTVTQNNPPNPPQVVRNIWDWHVNGNGWADIGYNFLIDQFGNIYQGRYNPWLDETDVRGAHAGFANSQSVGIGLLGQFHPPESSPPPSHPDSRAVASAEQLIAWRFYQRGLYPLESAEIPSTWGNVVIPRISGHRNVSATACPGDNLYAILPEIRNNVLLLLEFDVFYAGAPGTGPGGSTPDFTSLKAAADFINTHTFERNVIIFVTSDLTENDDVAIGATTNGYSLTIKPYFGVSPTIQFTDPVGGSGATADRPFIYSHLIIGATASHEDSLRHTQNIIIDGSNSPEGNSRNLTFVGATTEDVKSVIRVIGNATGVEIRNLNIESHSQAAAAIDVTHLYSGGDLLTPDDLLIENNEIVSGYGDGILIWNYDLPSVGLHNARIADNHITASRYGINAVGVSELTIRNNTFALVSDSETSKGILVGAVAEESDGEIIIAANEFKSITTSAGGELIGIDLQLTNNSTVRVYNNLIGGFQIEPQVTDLKLFGIRHAASGNVTSFVYHNTVLIPELTDIPDFGNSVIAAFAFEQADGSPPSGTADLRNNILYLDETGMPVYGIYRVGTSGVLLSDVNNIFVHSPNGKIGRYDETDAETLHDWQTSTGLDTLSVSVAVDFVSGSDARLTGTSLGDINLAAIPIAWITTDVDGNPRRHDFPFRPYKGAHEPAVPIVEVMTIAEARERPSGSVISVKGIVTRARGGQLSLQDETAGLIVRQFSGPLVEAIADGSVSMGDQLRVQGVITETSQLKQIGPGNLQVFEVLSRNNELPPHLDLTLQEVVSTGRTNQGMLVKVHDVLIDNRGHSTFRAGFTYPLSDPTEQTGMVSLRVTTLSETEIIGHTIPQNSVTIEGILMQSHATDPNAGFQIMAVLASDISGLVGVEDEPSHVITFQLYQNHPNPFNPSTTIRYSLPEKSAVTIEIYNVLGQHVKTLVDGIVQSPGYHEVLWDAVDNNGVRVPSGVYLYRITAGTYTNVKRMVFIK